MVKSIINTKNGYIQQNNEATQMLFTLSNVCQKVQGEGVCWTFCTNPCIPIKSFLKRLRLISVKTFCK